MSEVPGSGLSTVTASSPVSSVSGAAVVPDSVNVSTPYCDCSFSYVLDSSPLQTDVRRFSGSLSQSNSSGSSCPVLPSPSSSTSFVLSPSNPSLSFSSPSSTSLVLTPSASRSPPSFSPPSSSTSVQLTPSMSRASPVLNPLVDAGLISQDLADILATLSKDAAAVAKQGLKRITGARELTTNDYFEMLKERQSKKKRLEEEKKRNNEEREQKKKEKEKLRQISKGRGKPHGMGLQRRRGKGRGDKGKSKLVDKDPSNTDLSSDESVCMDIPVPSTLRTMSSTGESSSSAHVWTTQAPTVLVDKDRFHQDFVTGVMTAMTMMELCVLCVT